MANLSPLEEQKAQEIAEYAQQHMHEITARVDAIMLERFGVKVRGPMPEIVPPTRICDICGHYGTEDKIARHGDFNGLFVDRCVDLVACLHR